MKEGEEDMLTVQEAAGELGVDDSAIRRAVLQNRLPCIIKYGRKLITRAALEAYRARTRPEGVKPRGRPRKVAE